MISGSTVFSSIHAEHAEPWHNALKFSTSIQKVRLPHTGQSLHCMVDKIVIASSPTISTSQITTLQLSSNICSLFFRKVRNTCQAVSSLLKQPSAIVPPFSSVKDGTNTLGIDSPMVMLNQSNVSILLFKWPFCFNNC